MPDKKKPLFDKNTFKKGIAFVESGHLKDPYSAIPKTKDGKLLSSAAGKYQFLWKQLKDNNPELLKGITKEQFLGNKDLQEQVMDLAIEGKLNNRVGYFKNAEDLINDYQENLGDKWNFRPDEVAAISHFLGRQGARNYFRSLSKGEEFKTPGQNLSVDDYLNKYNKAIGSGRGIQLQKSSRPVIETPSPVAIDNTQVQIPTYNKIQQPIQGQTQPKFQPTPSIGDFLEDYIMENQNKFFIGGNTDPKKKKKLQPIPKDSNPAKEAEMIEHWGNRMNLSNKQVDGFLDQRDSDWNWMKARDDFYNKEFNTWRQGKTGLTPNSSFSQGSDEYMNAWKDIKDRWYTNNPRPINDIVLDYRDKGGTGVGDNVSFIKNNNIAKRADGGFIEFNTGGSHEQNPLGGIPIGMGSNGAMNTVEEGETMKGDYVFSDRITLDPMTIQKHALPKNLKNKTIAEASKILTKQAKESVDKIDKDSANEMLERLQNASEDIRLEMGLAENNQMFFGGNQSMYNQEPYGMNKGTAQGWEATKDAVGSAIPIAGAFRQAEKGLTNMAYGFGDEAGDMTKGFLDPFSNVLRKDTSVGQKVLSVMDPVVAGLITRKKNKEERNKKSRELDYSLNNQFTNDFGWGGSNTDPNKVNLKQGVTMDNSIPDIIDAVPTYYTANKSNSFLDEIGSGVSKAGEWVGDNYGSMLRYAPVVANAAQLFSLDKPEEESLDRIDSRYSKTPVDERSLMNIASSEYNNVSNAIKESTTSAGALRSNLLAAHLNKAKALSNGFLQAEEINRRENQTAQQFDRQADLTNIQQSNTEKDWNARNRAAYDNNKSKLISQLGTDIGNIGLEEMRKKYPERLGLLYDWLGRYYGNKEE